MKKFYFSILMFVIAISGFGQTFYSENFGTPGANTAITAYTGYQVTTVTYTGTGSVRASTASTGYTNASGGGNVFMNTSQTFMIEGLNTSAYSAANLQLTFGFKQDQGPALPASNILLEKSTDGTNWTTLNYERTGTAWELITVANSNIPSATNLRLRWTNTGTTNSQYRIDDIRLSSVSATCLLQLAAHTAVCDASTLNMDTYTATIPFTGGGTATYNIVTTSGTISGNNPSTTATGNIVITNITEGTDIIVTITGGTCNTTREIDGVSCKPVNTLPYYESFNYQAGTVLGIQQKWAEVNSGDGVIIATGNLNYTGITPTGNSASFAGAGAEAYTPFAEITAGKVYTSFLMNVTDMSGITTDLAQSYFAGLMSGTSTSSYNARLWTQKNGAQYKIGLSYGNTTTNYTSASYNVGDVVLVVLEFDYATNVVKAWINPTVATFNPASTAATLTETLTTAPASFGGFILRQDSDTTTPAITIDELRVSTSNTLGTKSNEIAGFSMFPNPLTGNVLNITSNSNADKTVAVFDVLGKQVLNGKVTEGTVNVSGLTSGIYIVKVTEEGKTATRKLVVK